MGGSRYEKVQGALHGVGVSVIGGAVTTGGTSLPLHLIHTSHVLVHVLRVSLTEQCVRGMRRRGCHPAALHREPGYVQGNGLLHPLHRALGRLLLVCAARPGPHGLWAGGRDG